MWILKFILIALEVLLIFNLLIGVHELGHFLAARWRGLKIDRFSIWFGKPIWKKKINGVEYALGWAPFGGYVALPQMATMEAIEGKSESSDKPLPPISPMDKIIVAFAGPLFSFLLAVVFAVVVWLVGRPVSTAGDSTVIGWVIPDGPAWNAGLRPGDQILEVDGHVVNHYHPPPRDSIRWRVVAGEATNITVRYKRDEAVFTTSILPTNRPAKEFKLFGLIRIPVERRPLRQIFIDASYPAVIGEVLTNSPAAAAGLQPGDEIVAVDGQRIHSYAALFHLEQQMTNGALRPVRLLVRRGDGEFHREVQPQKPMQPTNAPPSFGIAWQVDTNVTLLYQQPFDQIKESAGQIFATLSALFRSKDIGVQQLGGAVMIMRVYSNFFSNEQGWRLVLWFSVVINVNLALLNLLPFPVLDGGHITLAIVEAIRRRPVSVRLLQYVQTGCALVLIAFMLFIAFLDTGDWFRSAREDREDGQAIIFAPKQ
jgi:regulator of sigma E protease